MERKNSLSTVDAIIPRGNEIFLIRRRYEPFKGKLALPGGHVDYGESVEDATIREVFEETSLEIKIEDLEDILGVYSEPNRDPRGHVVSTIFVVREIEGEPKADSDAEEVGLFDPSKLKEDELAFDHSIIIGDYLKYKEQKGTYWSTRR